MSDLFGGLTFTIGSLFLLILSFFAYYFQEKRKGIKTDLFRCILIIDAVLIVSELISSMLLYDEFSPVIGKILLKAHWYTGIAYLFFFYFYADAYIKDIDDINIVDFIWKRTEGKIITIFSIIMTIVFIVVPFGELDYHYLSYLPGWPAYIIFSYVAIIVFASTIKYMFKKNKNKNLTVVMFGTIIVSLLDLGVQLVWPTIAFSPILMTLIVFSFYLLLENPDLYVANELEKSRKGLETVISHRNKVIKEKTKHISNDIYNITTSNYNLINNDNTEESKISLDNNINKLTDIIYDIENVFNMLIVGNNNDIDKYEYNTGILLSKLYKNATNRTKNKKSVSIIFDVDQFLPITLYGNEFLIYQTLLYSINTAINNTSVGRVMLKIRCSFTNNQVELNISITDTGNGLTEEDVTKINNDSATVEDIKSIERYLISKRYVSLLGGHYSLSSSYRVGTTINMSFTQNIINQNKIGQFKLIEPSYNMSLSNKKLLIVDTFTDDLTHIINKFNINYEVVNSIDECINKLKVDDSFTTVFINPDLNNLDKTIARSIKVINSNMKVIALSSNMIFGTKKNYLEQGYDSYLIKPYDEYDISELIKRI